jgi:hypothetical protein
MRDAVDYEVVLRRIVVFNAAKRYVFRYDVAAAAFINAVD